MSRLAGLRVLVVGAGAIGSALAFTLADDGAAVTLADPARRGDNASGVAAGMLAPAFETALDPVSAGRFPLLTAARDAWPAFVARLDRPDARLDRAGALWVGDDAALQQMQARLVGLGARAEMLGAGQAAALSPGLDTPAGAVLTPDDWRLEGAT